MSDCDARRLAEAMHDSDEWPDLRSGHQGEKHLWVDCNDEHRQRYENLADRYTSRMRGAA